MYKLNDKIKTLTPYDPAAGDYKIRLDANESFINPGVIFKSEIAEAVSKVDFNRYPDPTCQTLREAFGKAYAVKPQLTMAGNGSDEIIAILLGTFLQAGDKVVSITPDFSMYGFYGHVYEKENISLTKNDDLTINVEKLILDLQKIRPQALIFSNPCSPTSHVLKKEEIKKIVNSTDALVVLDEAYMEFSDQSLLSEVEKHDNLVILKTCSKAWGLAAIRLGFAVSNETVITALNAVRSPYNVNSITQAVGAAILGKRDFIEDAKVQLLKQREQLYENLALLENRTILAGDKNAPIKVVRVIKPETNFVLLEFEDIISAKTVYEYLLDKSIIVRVLNKFLRITAGNEKENAAIFKAFVAMK